MKLPCSLFTGNVPLAIGLLGVAMAAPGCGSSYERFVQIRAADDFECTADGIDVDEIGRSRYRARGCGKEGDYVCSATPDGVDCSQSSQLDVLSPSTHKAPGSEPTAAPTTT